MDFQLTDEQHELQRIARDVAERECPPSLVRAVVEDGHDAVELWKTLVAMEWPGLTIPLTEGGSGATAVELVVVLEQLGWAADPSPFLATTTQYVPLIRNCAHGAKRTALLEEVCAGGTGAAVASGSITARRANGAWLLDGRAQHVFDGDRADQLAVVAPTEDGPAVFVLPSKDADVARQACVDTSLHLAMVNFRGTRVAADQVWTGDGVADGLARAREEAVVGLAAAMVGACQRIFDLVLDHIKQRRQFGAVIGSFQAVKHMAVDVHVAIERARALCQYAALALAENDPRRTTAASMAKAAAGDAQRISVQHGIQLFGALGTTWENDLQFYVKRAKAADTLLGTGREHRLRVARQALEGLAR